MRPSCTAIALCALTALAGCTGEATDAAGQDDGAPTSGAACSGPASDERPAEPDAAGPDGAGAGAGPDVPDPTAATEDPDVETTASRELPATFPSEVVLPAEYAINVATESVTGASRSYVLQLRTPGEPPAVFEQLTTRFSEGGWEELQQSTSNFGDSFTSSATYSNGTIMVNLGVIEGEQAGTAAVSYSVVPAGPVAAASG